MNITQESIGLKEYKALTKKGGKRKKSEENLQLAVCAYLKKNYPGIIFFCDMSSGMKMPIWLAARNKKMRSSRGLPDLFIAQPQSNGILNYHGFFIELKKEGIKTVLKNGNLPADKHLKEQNEILRQLLKLGYKACFASGYVDAIKKIDDYLHVEAGFLWNKKIHSQSAI